MRDSMSNAVVDTMGGMTDALANFVATGKGSFRDFTVSVLQDLSRVLIKMAIMKALQSAMGMFAGSTAPEGFGTNANISANLFADGGYTGAGGKFDVAGLVHKGEGVLSQRDIGAMGGPSAFEAFRASLHTSYADGGYVSAAQPGYSGESKSAPAIVNIIEDNSKAGKVEQKTDDMDRQIINVFVRNIRSGGDAAEALQGAYGLSRAGR